MRHLGNAVAAVLVLGVAALLAISVALAPAAQGTPACSAPAPADDSMQNPAGLTVCPATIRP